VLKYEKEDLYVRKDRLLHTEWDSDQLATIAQFQEIQGFLAHQELIVLKEETYSQFCVLKGLLIIIMDKLIVQSVHQAIFALFKDFSSQSNVQKEWHVMKKAFLQPISCVQQD